MNSPFRHSLSDATNIVQLAHGPEPFALWLPAFAPSPNCAVRNTLCFGHIDQRGYRTRKSCFGRGLLVSRLRLRQCPSAVARLVVPVHVNSVNAMGAGRAQAHVRPKSRERVEPALAHSNATPSVLRIFAVRRSVTAGLHALPRLVFGSARTAVLGESGDRQLALQASARGHSAGQQVSRVDLFFAATRTVTQPPRTFHFSGLRDATHNRQATEVLAGQVLQFRHESHL